ncbi:MAG TPA: hypothetical protein VID27_19795 [Blastocatellia bacterium]|jgi:hypothetical protein
MEAKKTSYESLNISARELVSLISEMIGGTIAYPDPDNPTPPGPWDPYLRKALLRLGLIFGPTPEPWRPGLIPVPDPWRPVFGPGPQPWNLAAPGPLPPKAAFAAFIAQEVIDRALLVQEIADAMAGEGQSQGIIIVGGMVSRFIDDCGNDKLWRKRPFPPPKGESDNPLTALELIVMGAQFEQGALSAASEQLQQELRNAGARLTEMGVARR